MLGPAPEECTDKVLPSGARIRLCIPRRGELVEAFRKEATPDHTYLFGVSEGGLVTTLSIERYPHLYSGGLSMCGPIGSFREQLNCFGDVRVLVDHFFPGLIPGSAIQVPPDVIARWLTEYLPRVEAAIAANPGAAS